MKIGLIGLGNIGVHFGTRLLAAGHDLSVFDTSDAAMKRLQEKGAAPAASTLDLANRCDVVLLCLPMPAAVSKVACGPGGVIEGKAVRMVVDLSTTGPSVTNEVAAALAAKGIGFLGAPVSGGTVAAEKGTLAIMPSGDESVFKEVEPILRTLGKNIFYMGSAPGNGQTMKIINNTLYAVSMVASCEALVYGAKAGLDPQTMLDVLNASSGRSFSTQERIPQCVLHRNFPLRFTTELLHKDVKMCIDEAEKLGVPMQIGPAARQFLAFAITQGDGAKDNIATIRHFEEWAGVEFGAAPSDPAAAA
ncbi:NAD(P)-dependent oxidoreductase [Lacisediminimonas profundi]|uniref:NAD(P)-dependent oxidoreductase n=1 Tax=Lacisediminimonas profundi TaxID=2603856 RepID=UPI00124B257B|nr:NAD(P)-dependent oxidoreductase [Lacisediminimonas profundi]